MVKIDKKPPFFLSISESVTSIIFELEKFKDSFGNPRLNICVLAVNFERFLPFLSAFAVLADLILVKL